jgi:hypothetical protein
MIVDAAYKAFKRGKAYGLNEAALRLMIANNNILGVNEELFLKHVNNYAVFLSML